MRYVLNLAGIKLCLDSERVLKVEPEWEKFLEESCSEYDVLARISWDWERAMCPVTAAIGRDSILEYYVEGDKCFCNTRLESKGFLTSTVYSRQMEQMICTINEKPFLTPPDSVGRIMRALPVREILMHFSVLFFHAAQVSCHGKSILFAAPSGTGKTTQAKLWQDFRGAKLVSSDRTLVRNEATGYMTYSFPLDGSEPVSDNGVNPLGAIVLLEQGEDNRIKELSLGKKLALLMEQLVLDDWNAASREENLLLLMELIKEIPIYYFSCTPDAEAVDVLWDNLIKDGVIVND